MIPLSQGELTIERMCALAGIGRAGYYRHWGASAPRQEETAIRDAVQRVALAHKHYGYRRVAEQMRREGIAVNHKRVLRLMREDNLLCLRARPFVPVTTLSRHGWRVVPNLARGTTAKSYRGHYAGACHRARFARPGGLQCALRAGYNGTLDLLYYL
jgi:putative transposase